MRAAITEGNSNILTTSAPNREFSSIKSVILIKHQDLIPKPKLYTAMAQALPTFMEDF